MSNWKGSNTWGYKLSCCGVRYKRSDYYCNADSCIQTCPYCQCKKPALLEVDRDDVTILVGHSGDRQSEERPWGSFKIVLDEPNVKIKKIIVKPKCRLSLQLHTERDEWWKIICGTAEVQKGNEIIELGMFDTVEINRHEVHRVENVGNEDLIFVEVQTGVCREDDIVRISDDYGRI